MWSGSSSSSGTGAGQPVDARGDAAVGRRPELERLEQVAEHLPGALVAHADDAEDLLLDLAPVDSDRAARDLVAVADRVVLLGARDPGVGVEQRQVLVERHG